MNKKNPGVTLVELVISVALMSLLVLSYFQIDSFSRFQVVSSNRKARLQSDVSLILEQITKDAVGAIGSDGIIPYPGHPPTVQIIYPGGVTVLRIWVDGNPYINDSDPGYDGDDHLPNSRRDDLLACPNCDHEVGFSFTGATGAVSDMYQVRYYRYCRGPRCDDIAGYVGPEVLSKHILSFTPALVNNIIDLDISARWKPAEAASIENPTVTMRSRLNMPAVSNR